MYLNRNVIFLLMFNLLFFFYIYKNFDYFKIKPVFLLVQMIERKFVNSWVLNRNVWTVSKKRLKICLTTFDNVSDITDATVFVATLADES